MDLPPVDGSTGDGSTGITWHWNYLALELPDRGVTIEF
jgi:hypothetical protein